MSLSEKLSNIQRKIKCNKSQYNSFGKYNYRSCEDILEAVKPFLENCHLILRDEVKDVAGIPYIETTAILSDEKEEIKVTAQAGIDPNRKGMDVAQCFGASSSYSRKYALSGLFLLDDTKDADSTNTHGKEEKRVDVKPQPIQQASKPEPIQEYARDMQEMDNAEGGDLEAMKLEMAKWINDTADGMEKFKKITKGHYSNPLDIKTEKNVRLAYDLWKKAIVNSVGV